MKRGSTDIVNPKRGSTDIQSVYRGTSLIWSRTTTTTTTTSTTTLAPPEEFPIGTLEAYLKSYTNVPSYSSDWVECNGQVLNDPTSPLHNQTIPNLNGSGGATKRFLRGSTTSGSVGGNETQSHTHTASRIDVKITDPGDKKAWSDYSNETINILPRYYEVVWIIKIK